MTNKKLSRRLDFSSTDEACVLYFKLLNDGLTPVKETEDGYMCIVSLETSKKLASALLDFIQEADSCRAHMK